MGAIGKRRLLKAHIRCGNHRRESIERLALQHKMYVDGRNLQLTERQQHIDAELKIMELRLQ